MARAMFPGTWKSGKGAYLGMQVASKRGEDRPCGAVHKRNDKTWSWHAWRGSRKLHGLGNTESDAKRMAAAAWAELG